jgi:ribosomal protein S18 acetylase RimI-like enzyme
MEIRKYQKNDFAQFCVLIDEFNDYIVSIDTENIVKSLSSQADIESYTDKTIKDAEERNGFIYLAVDNGNIIGFIQGICDSNDKNILYKLTHEPFVDGWIGELYVKPEYRGRGLGKELINKAKQFFKDKGCRFVRLQVMNDNIESLNIYKKLGFKIRDLELTSEIKCQ